MAHSTDRVLTCLLPRQSSSDDHPQFVVWLRSTKLTVPSRSGIRAMSTGWVSASVTTQLEAGELESTITATPLAVVSDAPLMRMPYPPVGCAPSATTTIISREKSTAG